MLAFVRVICITAVRLYFREISVSGEEVNDDILSKNEGDNAIPVLIVANHPNGLLDPLVVQLALKRKVRFLAKSTLFENIFGRTASLAFGAIPVYRTKDGQDTSKNHSMFDAVYDAFKEKSWVVIFPEGVSHDLTTLLPLKTGAARMAIGANLEELHILPIGITYDNKDQFRSRVNVNFGEILEWSSLKGDEHVRELTESISMGLKEAMFETPSEDIRQGLFFVARWLENDAPIAELEEKAKELESAYAKLLNRDPACAQELTDDIRGFARDLESVGLQPWNLEEKASIQGLAFLIIFSPIALLGFLVHYPIYVLISIIVNRMAKSPGKGVPERDLLGTLKTLGALIFYPLGWIVLALLFTLLFNWKVGVLVGLSLIPLALFTLRYTERFNRRRRALSRFWLSRVTPHLATQIHQTRDQLMERISKILTDEGSV